MECYKMFYDVDYLRECLKEMKGYERNWEYMTVQRRKDIMPFGGKRELVKQIKMLEAKIKELA